jgi:hypothetical protein
MKDPKRIENRPIEVGAIAQRGIIGRKMDGPLLV